MKEYLTISKKMGIVLKYGSIRQATEVELMGYEFETNGRPVWLFEPFEKDNFDTLMQCSSLSVFLDNVLFDINLNKNI